MTSGTLAHSGRNSACRVCEVHNGLKNSGNPDDSSQSKRPLSPLVPPLHARKRAW
jgi:hypothetical protein